MDHGSQHVTEGRHGAMSLGSNDFGLVRGQVHILGAGQILVG